MTLSEREGPFPRAKSRQRPTPVLLPTKAPPPLGAFFIPSEEDVRSSPIAESAWWLYGISDRFDPCHKGYGGIVALLLRRVTECG